MTTGRDFKKISRIFKKGVESWQKPGTVNLKVIWITQVDNDKNDYKDCDLSQ